MVDAASLAKYPNHFSPAGMDFFAVPNEEVARGEYWSLIGVGSQNVERVRQIVREWLELGPKNCRDVSQVERLSPIVRVNLK
jgi:hypothetical protein